MCRHTIQSGVWSSSELAYYQQQRYSIQGAVTYWYRNATKSGEMLVFRDSCYAPHCNNQCPEEFVLQELHANSWSKWRRVVVSLVVISIALVCLAMKVCIYRFIYTCANYHTIFYTGLFLCMALLAKRKAAGLFERLNK